MEADKLVKEILEIVNTLNEHGVSDLSGDTLSRIVLKLASYKASLGEHVAEARRLAWDAEAAYVRNRAEAYKSLRESGKGATDADELKRLESHDFLVAWNTAKYNYERISNLHNDCHDLIDGIKSRLIGLHTEAKEVNVS